MKSPILFVHGFNLHPERMKHIAAAFTDRKTEIVVLPGHEGKGTRGITYHDWIATLESKVQAAAKESPTKKVSILGFSLGALISVLLFSQSENIPVDKFYGLAPGFWPNFWRIYRAIAKISSPLSFDFPSLASSSYRANASVHPQLYFALFEAARIAHQDHNRDRFKHIHGRVVVHPRDLLVSARKARSWVRKNTSWEFDAELIKDSRSLLNHMLIDKWCMGEKHFEVLLSDIKNFFA